MEKERLMNVARYSWHVGMQLLRDVIALTMSHLCVSKKEWCVVVFCAVDLVRIDFCSLCQCTLKSTSHHRSGELSPVSPT